MDTVTKILDKNNWPDFDNPDHLDELAVIADTAFGKGTVEGYLAALLIYHQLCDEMSKLLLECSHFFIQLSTHPTGVKFKIDKNVMSGRLLTELEHTLDFDGKYEFISKNREFNSLRNKIVHGLTKNTSLDELKSKLESIQQLYGIVFALFVQSHDWFNLCFHDFKKDVFIDAEENKEIT